MAQVVSKGFVFSSACDYVHVDSRHSLNGLYAFPNTKAVNLSCLPSLKLQSSYLSRSHFYGGRLEAINEGAPNFDRTSSKVAAVSAQMGIGLRKAPKWWEKGLQPNMKEVSSAQDLVDSLSSAGDKLVVVDFFSPGCGGCKALHPKICQLAEMNPDVQFLQVNYEEHKSMCYSLNVHVLPFFRFYRGAQGRVCSFSCTNATIKKFRDALAKYGTDGCTDGPPKGLEEKELLALAANKDLSFNYTPKKQEEEAVPLASKEQVVLEQTTKLSPPSPLPLPLSLPVRSLEVAKQDSASQVFASSGR